MATMTLLRSMSAQGTVVLCSVVIFYPTKPHNYINLLSFQTAFNENTNIEKGCIDTQAPQGECQWLRGPQSPHQASDGSRGLGGQKAPAAAAENAAGDGEGEAAGTAG